MQTRTSPSSVTLLDGLVVSGIANETFTTVGGSTTSVYERVTNIVAVNNTGFADVSDSVCIFSDLFSPSIAGAAGVGIAGYYGAAGLGGIPTGGIYGASSQAQMKFLTAAAAPRRSRSRPSRRSLWARLASPRLSSGKRCGESAEGA